MNFDFDVIKWWVEDHLREIIILTGVLVVLVGGIYGVRVAEDDGSPKGVEETLTTLITTSQELKETFSLLDERSTGVDSKYPVLELDLYVKRPFIESFDLESELNKYVDALKLINESKGIQVRAIRFTLYDRRILWQERLRPKGVFEYRYKNSTVTQDDVATAISGTETQTYDQAAWAKTLAAKGKPKYNNYALAGNYKYLTPKPGVDLLTDQEFAWFLKYDLYRQLGGGFNLYLTWDLGAQPREDGRVMIKKQFDEFVKRLDSIRDYTEYYDYADRLKRQLVIDKPQFLYYSETKDVAKDDDDARRKLLEYNPRLYTETIDEWLTKQARQQVEQTTNGSYAPEGIDYDAELLYEPDTVYNDEPLLDAPILEEPVVDEAVVE